MGEFRPVPDVLLYLAGSWLLERSVRDLASADDTAEGTFTGTTTFSPLDGGGLLHHESGTFAWQGVTRPAERTLRFLPGGAPGTADVRFADGRPFHDLDLTAGRWITDHPCAADLYRGEFTVLDTDHWRTVWRVAGPAKDLVITTDCTRETGARPRPERGTGRYRSAAPPRGATSPHRPAGSSPLCQRSAQPRPA